MSCEWCENIFEDSNYISISLNNIQTVISKNNNSDWYCPNCGEKLEWEE